MSKQPAISVIMPCYNEAERLNQSVCSVYEQSFSDLELIVVDDGSSDDSLSVLEKLSKQYTSLRYFSQKNKGAGPARNRGLKEARGEMIAFLDADDSWHPDCLKKLHEKLTETKDTVIAYCGWQNIGLDENRCKPFIPPNYEQPEKIETLLRGCRWPIHAALTRSDAMQKVGGFDETWTSCMDYDLWLRIASFNKIALVPEVLAFYHHHDGEQITNNRSRIALNHWRIQKQFLINHPEISHQLGAKKIGEITHGELLHRAYICYWDRNLEASHTLFRTVLSTFHFKVRDLKYLLPALLPYKIYQSLITLASK